MTQRYNSLKRGRDCANSSAVTAAQSRCLIPAQSPLPTPPSGHGEIAASPGGRRRNGGSAENLEISRGTNTHELK